jgi:hypothetical protein
MVFAKLNAMRLKVCVLADGTIQVEGRPATIEDLEAALSRTKEANGQIWYYREAAPGEAPPLARQVTQRLVALKLPISLSSKPDFSDWVDAKGVSHPRHAPNAGKIHMPEVGERSGLDEYFATIRRTAAGKGDGEGLVIVKPDRSLTVVPRLAESAELETMAESMKSMVPDGVQRNIVAIAFTEFEPGSQGTAGLEEVGKAIPFLGMLVGFSYIGHAVWVFEGHPSALTAGCRDADLLLVDSAMQPFLPDGWVEQAAAVMRNDNILVHNRANFTLSAVRKVGTDPGQIEFRS